MNYNCISLFDVVLFVSSIVTNWLIASAPSVVGRRLTAPGLRLASFCRRRWLLPRHDSFPVLFNGLLLELVPALALLGQLRFAGDVAAHLVAKLVLAEITLAFGVLFIVVVAGGILLVLGLLLLIAVLALDELHPGALLQPPVEILANLLQDQVPLKRLLALQVNDTNRIEICLQLLCILETRSFHHQYL